MSKGKGKGKAYLYSAFNETSRQGARVWDTQGCPSKLHHTCLYLANVCQIAPPEWQTVVSSNQMAAISSQWWCRLVNAYEVKAGMVCLQCKNYVIHARVYFRPFRGEVLTMGRYTNLRIFSFTYIDAQ